MAIKEHIAQERDSLIEKIDNSNIDEAKKTWYKRLLSRTAEGTNGLSKEEKIQSVSTSVFDLCEATIVESLELEKKFSDLDEKISNRFEEMSDGIDEKFIKLSKIREAQLAQINEKLDTAINHNPPFWGVIERCKWAIIVGLGIISFLLLFHPELGNIIGSFISK